MRRFILIAALSMALQSGYAQSQYRFHHFGSVMALALMVLPTFVRIVLDLSGAATHGRLSRFDGYDFKIYKSDPADSLSSPSSDWIDRIGLDQCGNLWMLRSPFMAPDNSFSLMRYDKKTDSFTKIKPPAKGFISAPSFSKGEPVIWLAGDGLSHFNYVTNELKSYRIHSIDSLNHNIIYARDCGDYLLMTTFGDGIWRFDKVTEKFSRPKCDPKDSTLFYSAPLSFIFTSAGPLNSNFSDLWIVFIGTKFIGTEYFAQQMVELIPISRSPAVSNSLMVSNYSHWIAIRMGFFG